MKKLTVLLGLLFSLLAIPHTVEASHMMGVDLTYECLNNCTIRVHLRAYRDCSGASGITNFITFNSPNPACASPTPIGTWSAQVTTEVTPLCPGAQTQCTNSSSQINGVEEYYWYSDYDICSVPGCTYNIEWGSCCRNGAITSGAGNESMYISQTTLNTSLTTCNGSPQFLNPPVPYICAGQPYTFNQGALDPEGDSLSYSLGPCYQSTTGTQVTYNAGYSPTQPLGSSWNVSINPTTGDITVLPTPGNLVVGVMCVYVTEWRNGLAINTIVRDIQMTVLNCPGNNLPAVNQLTNPVNGQINGFVVTTCINNPLCFNIPSVDPDPTQTVTIMWSQNIPGGVFSQVGNPSVTDTITGTLGTPPQAQFCWTPPALGTYSFLVTVIDNACPITGQSQFTIQIIVGNLQTSAILNSAGCGTVNLCANPVNGNGPYTFQWSGPGGLTGNPNATDSCLTHTYPATGTYPYYLEVTDVNGCIGYDTGSVSVVINVQADAGPDVAICSGASTQIGTPAQPNYSYSWSPATGLSSATAAVPTVTRTNPGTTPVVHQYILTATDLTTACVNRDTVLVTVWPPIQPSTSTVQPSCNGGSNGTATVTIVGGVPPFTYNWGPSAGNQTTPTATGLTAGTYTVVIVDSGGCSATATAVVTQPTAVNASATMSPVSCFGGNNGSVSASAIGGVGGYTFTWSNGSTGPIVPGLPIGTYTVTATDTRGCTDTASVTVTQPTALQLTMSATSTTCALPLPNGTASVVVSGGVGNYTYVWSTVPAQTTSSATGLSGGNYSVTVTDGNGCSAVASTTVGAIPPPIVTAGPDVTACEGSGGTTITASPSSGTPGYWFVWTCASGNCGLSSMNAASPTANPTTSQYYYVQVTDTNGCTSNVDSLWFEVLPKPIVNAGPDLIICGDSAPCQILNPIITAAPGPYTYNWFPATGLNDPTIMNPCARPDTTTPYTLVVTGGNGCTSDFTTTDTLSTAVVHVNPIPVADAGPDREICAGDSVELEGLGFNAGPVYGFEWSPATGVSSTTQPNPNVAPPITTVYTLVVWSNGCPSYGDQVLVDVHTNPTVDAGPTKEICLGESILIDAQAGGDSTATYSFNWTPATNISDPGIEDPIVNPVSTTTYYVQATTNFGCNSPIDSVLVRVKPTPIAEAGENIVLCAGGEVQLNGSYSYTTTDSAPNASQVYFVWTPNIAITSTTILDPIVNPTASGWYHLQVLHNTCVTEDSVLVTVVPGLGLTVSADTTAACSGDSVTLTAVAGLGNAQFTWIPAAGIADPGSPVTTAAPDSSTTYTVIAAQGGCADTASIDIAIIPTPIATFSHSSVLGCYPFNVNFLQTAEDGVAYVWTFGDGSAVDNFPQATHIYEGPGTYHATLTVMGPGGCTDVSDSVAITVIAPPRPSFVSDPEFPATMSLPNTTVNFTNTSTGAINYVWSFDDGSTSVDLSPTHSYQAEGQYMVTLTATNEIGCVASVTNGPFVVISPELFIPNVFSPNGDGQNDRFVVEYTGSQPFTLQVMDRWGVQLYNGNNKWDGWDGLNMEGQATPDGVYFFQVKVGEKEFVGNVTLVR
jgi:gliding motility-associated-like protein